MDASDKTCVEHLRPKTVPEQLIAYGTVSQISDIQIKLQITGGIVCIVDRAHVSSAYTDSLRKYNDNIRIGKKADEPPRLSQLFKKGQRYVCKIIERRTRAGYADAQDILASLDPYEIQDENLPSTLFAIPVVPIQCAIISVEDHGYRVDIGFKNLSGFLKFEEAGEYCKKHNGDKNLYVGQVVRCYTLETWSLNHDVRMIQLSMRKELIKKSEFSREKVNQYALTERCILPGSSGYLMVMKVQKDGLVVNFLDEFMGFVTADHLKNDWHDAKTKYKISDQSKCTVLYYNCTTKTFALSLKPKKTSRLVLKQLVENYHVGQFIKRAEVVRLNGLKSINFKVDQFKAVANVKDALNEDVATMTKDELHLALDKAYPDGSVHKCRIKSINYADLVLVLSIRQDFLELPCVSPEELKPADFIDATVKRYVKDGVVVLFGLNLRAIILKSNLENYISEKSYQKYPVGMSLKCRVMKVDFNKHPARIYLTNKEQLMDPEMTIIDSYEESFRGETVNATVVKLSHKGVILEHFNNVKGFVPLRFCSNTQIRTVSDLFQVGQVVSATVYRVEPKRQSMLLSVIPYENVVKLIKEKKKSKKDKKKTPELVRATEKDDKENDKESTSAKRKITDSQKPSSEVEPKLKKSRLERSIEAKLREEKIREAEKNLLDTKRQAQSIPDFERLVLKTPNSGESWIKYSKFFLNNVETEKARLICRRALNTINFRQEKEKLKVWLHLIKIETMYGGVERLREVIDEAAQTNDRLELFQKTAKVLVNCGEHDEAERMHEASLKLDGKSANIWIDYATFIMEHRKDLKRARELFDKACKSLTKPTDLVYAKSRFARCEFQSGDVERGKTIFENLLCDNPKRMDLWKVYEDAIKKFGTRQLDNDEVREQNEQILQRIATLRK